MPKRQNIAADYAENVRAQYEDYPFPRRDPADERRRLIVSEQHLLAKLNHFCFGGRQSFNQGMRILVAGGGTGDQAIFLAEQLRDFDARLVYIDISEASLRIARERARVRGLENIEWHHGSLLKLPGMGTGPFDLISCTGVLHHLPDPDAGLRALKSVLAPRGAMSLMLYGRFGRLGVYAGQELMRLVNQGVADNSERVRNAKSVLRCLPDTNWLLRGSDREKALEPMLADDSNLFDLLLHEQDVAYSVPDIYAMLERQSLELIEFTHFLQDVPAFRYLYEPYVFIREPDLRARISRLPRPLRQGIAEAISCMLTCHAFYAAPDTSNRVAQPNDPEMVPGFLYFDPEPLIDQVRRSGQKDVAFPYRHSTVYFEPGRWSASIMTAIDGERTLPEIFETVRNSGAGNVPDGVLWEDFMRFYVPLNSMDVIVLRHKSVPAFPAYLPDSN
jgi:SAM-dependent methyltransferase